MSEERVNEILLGSAKENLEACAFFGIVEEQQKTQFLFEKTMGLKFIDNFRQKLVTHVSRLEITEQMAKRIMDKNRLDIELYQFAKDLFLQRVEYMEKKLGYTVSEYFSHMRDADDSGDDDAEEVEVDEYEDEDENEVDETNEEKAEFYPSRTTGATIEISSGSTAKWRHLR